MWLILVNQDTQGIVTFKTGTPGLNSSYAALYYPWLKPLLGKKNYVPPSGAIAGVYSATDVRRGVHKAPAGVIDGNLKSAVGLEPPDYARRTRVIESYRNQCDPVFQGAGITVWGREHFQQIRSGNTSTSEDCFFFLKSPLKRQLNGWSLSQIQGVCGRR